MFTGADYVAIQHLIWRYADLLDRGLVEEAGTLFDACDFYLGDDAVPVSPDGANRMAPIFREWMSMFPQSGGRPLTRHVTTNVIIAPNRADEAAAQSVVFVFQSDDQRNMRSVVAGNYEDRFRRVDGRWQFAERRLRPFGAF